MRSFRGFIVLTGFFFLLILLALTMSDYLTRSGWPVPLQQ